MEERDPLLSQDDSPEFTSVNPQHRYLPPEGDGNGEKRVKAALSTVHLVAVTFLIAVGGPYGLEGAVQYAGPLLTSIFVFVLPLLWCLPTTMCVAELACAIPSNGGPIMWINVAFPSWFCLMVVMWSLVQQFVDNALFPSLATSYITSVVPLSSWAVSLTKVALVSFCCLLNCLGVEIVGIGSVIIMVLALAPFVVMMTVFFTGSAAAGPGGLIWKNIAYIPPTIDWASFFPLVAWNLSGLDKSGNLAEEVRDPQKTFMKALLWVVVLTILVYVPPVLIAVSAWEDPRWSHWQSGYWTNVAKHIGGTPVQWIVFVGSCASSLGYLFTNICTTSRALAAMGSIGVFPGALGTWMGAYHSRFKTPINATVVNSIILCTFSIILDFGDLVAVDQILFSMRVMCIYLAVFILRKKYPTLKRPFRIPGRTTGHMIALLFLGFWFNVAMVVVSISGSTNIVILTVSTVVGSFIISMTYVKGYMKGNVHFKGDIVAIEPVVTDSLVTQFDPASPTSPLPPEEDDYPTKPSTREVPKSSGSVQEET